MSCVNSKEKVILNMLGVAMLGSTTNRGVARATFGVVSIQFNDGFSEYTVAG